MPWCMRPKTISLRCSVSMPSKHHEPPKRLAPMARGYQSSVTLVSWTWPASGRFAPEQDQR